MSSGRKRILAALALALGSAGCSEHEKIGECKALIGTINEGVEKIQKGTTTPPDGGAAVAELRALAADMDNIAQAVAKVALGLPELQQLSKRYQDMISEVATSARELATAVDKVDMEKMTKAQSRMETAVKSEDPLVEEINKLCQTP